MLPRLVSEVRELEVFAFDPTGQRDSTRGFQYLVDHAVLGQVFDFKGASLRIDGMVTITRGNLTINNLRLQR